MDIFDVLLIAFFNSICGTSFNTYLSQEENKKFNVELFNVSTSSYQNDIDISIYNKNDGIHVECIGEFSDNNVKLIMVTNENNKYIICGEKENGYFENQILQSSNSKMHSYIIDPFIFGPFFIGLMCVDVSSKSLSNITHYYHEYYDGKVFDINLYTDPSSKETVNLNLNNEEINTLDYKEEIHLVFQVKYITTINDVNVIWNDEKLDLNSSINLIHISHFYQEQNVIFYILKIIFVINNSMMKYGPNYLKCSVVNENITHEIIREFRIKANFYLECSMGNAYGAIEVTSRQNGLLIYCAAKNVTNEDKLEYSFSHPDNVTQMDTGLIMEENIVENRKLHTLNVTAEILKVKVSDYGIYTFTASWNGKTIQHQISLVPVGYKGYSFTHVNSGQRNSKNNSICTLLTIIIIFMFFN